MRNRARRGSPGSEPVLVLTRKRRQSIMIGDEVEITVLSCDGSNVRLGISAPAALSVHRTEIYEAIKSQETQAAGETLEARRARAAEGA